MGDPVHVARAKLARAVRSKDSDAEYAARVELTEAHLQRTIDLVLERPHKPRPEVVEGICEQLRRSSE